MNSREEKHTTENNDAGKTCTCESRWIIHEFTQEDVIQY